jgi:hypothetical protein
MTNVPMDNVPSDVSDVPINVTVTTINQMRGRFQNLQRRGILNSHLMRKLPRKHLKLSRLNFKMERPRTSWQRIQTETSAGKTKNQLVRTS